MSATMRKRLALWIVHTFILSMIFCSSPPNTRLSTLANDGRFRLDDYELIMCDLPIPANLTAVRQPTQYAYYSRAKREFLVMRVSWNDPLLWSKVPASYLRKELSDKEMDKLDSAVKNIVASKSILTDLRSSGRKLSADDPDMTVAKLMVRWPSDKRLFDPTLGRKVPLYSDFCTVFVADSHARLDEKYLETTFPLELFHIDWEQIASRAPTLRMRGENPLNTRDGPITNCFLQEDARLLEALHEIGKTPLPANTLKALSQARRQELVCNSAVGLTLCEWLDTPFIFPAQIFHVENWLMQVDPDYVGPIGFDRNRVVESFSKLWATPVPPENASNAPTKGKKGADF